MLSAKIYTLNATDARRKRAGLLLVCILFVAACGSALGLNNAPQATSVAPQNTLIVGSEQDFPPFATGMTDESAGGFTVDLWRAVAAEAGLNYQLRVAPFRQILEEFKQGRIDVLLNLAQTNERHQFADFTVPHVVVHGAIFVRQGNTAIHTEGDLSGKSIIVLNADLAHDYALSKGWGKQLVLVDTAAEGMKLLASGRHDAMLLSKLTGMQTLQALDLHNIEPLKSPAAFAQKFAFAVQGGHAELLGKINEGLAMTKSDGTYNAIYEKWFGVYETKEAGLQTVLTYLAPLMLIFLGIAGSLFYQRQTERAAAERKYRDLYDHAPDMYMSVEARNQTIIDCNQTLENSTGYTREELIGRNVLELYHPDCANLAHAAYQQFFATGEIHGKELILQRKDGSKININLNATAVCDKHGKILHSRSALHDITERKRFEVTLIETESRFRFILENSPIAVRITDLHTSVVVFANQRYAELINTGRDKVLGINPKQYYANPQDYHDVIERLARGEQVTNKLIELRVSNAHAISKWTLASYLQLEFQGEPAVLGWFYDITDRKSVEDQVKHLAHYDPLTDLPNRTLFTDRLQQALTTARRDKTHLALMFIDLDKFKPINDRHGHHIGDLVLKDVAMRIQSCLRESDTVARIGGDEFVVLLPVIEATQDAMGVGEKIRHALNQPIELAGHTLSISSSTGVAIYPEHGAEEKQLIRNADTAMYYAKAGGRDNVKIYQPDMHEAS